MVVTIDEFGITAIGKSYRQVKIRLVLVTVLCVVILTAGFGGRKSVWIGVW